MTSRNLCFKLMVEDLKRRVWTIAWSVLSLFFGLVVPVALKCGDYKDRTNALAASDRMRLVSNIASLLYKNGFVVFILLVTAVLWAVSGFHYLHNSRKTDFYHSLPIKRHQLFLAAYLNGILIPLIWYLAAEVVSVVLVLQAGIGTGAFGSLPWQSMFLNMAYYCLMYTTVVVAMMMTGNVVVGLLGTTVFCVYGPAVSALFFGYQGIWFRSYYESDKVGILQAKLVRFSSPFANYMFALDSFYNKEWSMYRGVLVILVAAAAAILAYGLYRLRPSEAAGKAMAFEKTKAPIRFLITVPVSLAAGIFFYEMRSNNLGWLIFGTICGALLTHCLMEIIYHFDFRKLFAHRIQLAVCAFACLLLSLAGYFDWYGYDRWLPDAQAVESVAIRDYHDNWVSYGAPILEDRYDYAGSEQYYYWRMDNDHEFQYMELTDLYPILEIAGKGVEVINNTHRGEPVYGDFASWTQCVLKFRMKNGKEVYRRYNIPMDSHMQEMFASVYDSIEYKEGKYPVLSQTAEGTAGVYFQQYNKVKKVETDPQVTAQILEAFQQDLADLTVEKRSQELPIATIQFRTPAMEEAIEYNRHTQDYGYDYISDRCYYPVFPSFDRTIEILRENGIQPVELGSEVIEKLQIRYEEYYYDRAASGESEVVEIREPEEIDELADALCYQDYMGMNSDYRADTLVGIDIYAVRRDMESVDGTEYENDRYLPFVLDKNKLSPEIMEKYGFESSKNE